MAARKPAKSKEGTVAVASKVVRDGHTVWHVASGGKIRRISTRRASAKAIDEAMEIYAPALKRLADR